MQRAWHLRRTGRRQRRPFIYGRSWLCSRAELSTWRSPSTSNSPLESDVNRRDVQRRLAMHVVKEHRLAQVATDLAWRKSSLKGFCTHAASVEALGKLLNIGIHPLLRTFLRLPDTLARKTTTAPEFSLLVRSPKASCDIFTVHHPCEDVANLKPRCRCSADLIRRQNLVQQPPVSGDVLQKAYMTCRYSTTHVCENEGQVRGGS